MINVDYRNAEALMNALAFWYVAGTGFDEKYCTEHLEEVNQWARDKFMELTKELEEKFNTTFNIEDKEE